ncbi:bactofilin family protein [Treponema zioleckii]|uniref:bactofilin family protein n=1 Tax=Treponema zioleckii TaxID=331680 RepID=UPI00168B3972|nr:polymer-forming cytoskeletal protein [Treponema zioleckii]
MALFTDDISINTLIGSGSAISGNVKINGFVRVDGDIDGNLEASGNVIIGENSRINGDVTAKSAVIGGIVLGNVYAPESLKLLSSSAVIGDISTKKLQVENNVIIHGHCISLKNEDEFEKASSQHLDAQSIKSKAI